MTSFSQKDEVKARGAKWDPAMKKWHITGEQYAQDPAYWDQWSPAAINDVEVSSGSCPF